MAAARAARSSNGSAGGSEVGNGEGGIGEHGIGEGCGGARKQSSLRKHSAHRYTPALINVCGCVQGQAGFESLSPASHETGNKRTHTNVRTLSGTAKGPPRATTRAGYMPSLTTAAPSGHSGPLRQAGGSTAAATMAAGGRWLAGCDSGGTDEVCDGNAGNGERKAARSRGKGRGWAKQCHHASHPCQLPTESKAHTEAQHQRLDERRGRA